MILMCALLAQTGLLSRGVDLGKVHCIGDSITLGAGPGTRGSGYRWALNSLLADRSIKLDFVGTSTEWSAALPADPEHDGHGGWTTLDLLYGRDGKGAAPDWVAAQRPDRVLLMIGRNDPGDWSDILSRYLALGQALFDAKPDISLYWANVVNKRDYDAWDVARCARADLAVQSAVAFFRVQGRKAYYVDAWRSVPQSPEMYSDSVHLSDMGNDALARAWYRSVGLPVGTPIKKSAGG